MLSRLRFLGQGAGCGDDMSCPSVRTSERSVGALEATLDFLDLTPQRVRLFPKLGWGGFCGLFVDSLQDVSASGLSRIKAYPVSLEHICNTVEVEQVLLVGQNELR